MLDRSRFWNMIMEDDSCLFRKKISVGFDTFRKTHKQIMFGSGCIQAGTPEFDNLENFFWRFWEFVIHSVFGHQKQEPVPCPAKEEDCLRKKKNTMDKEAMDKTAVVDRPDVTELNKTVEIHDQFGQHKVQKADLDQIQCTQVMIEQLRRIVQQQREEIHFLYMQLEKIRKDIKRLKMNKVSLTKRLKKILLLETTEKEIEDKPDMDVRAPKQICNNSSTECAKNNRLSFKNLVLFLLLIRQATPVSSAVTPNLQYPLLHNPLCNKMKTCTKSDTLQERRVEFCFSDRCQDGFLYQCVEDVEYGGAMEICAPDQLCDKGKRKVAVYKKSSDSVSLKLEDCPDGYYQDSRTQCLQACRNKHPHVRDHVIVHRQPNTMSPGRGYCDYKNGWFNLDNVTFFSLSRQHACVHRGEHSLQCPDDKIVLPNGTCAVPCVVGYERDPDNEFRCSLKVSSNTKPPESTLGQSGQTVQSWDSSSTQSIGFTTKSAKDTVPSNQPNLVPVLTILAAVVVGILAIVVAVVVVMFCCKTKCRPRQVLIKKKSTKRRNCNDYTFNAKDLHVTIIGGDIETDHGNLQLLPLPSDPTFERSADTDELTQNNQVQNMCELKDQHVNNEDVIEDPDETVPLKVWTDSI